MLLAITIGLAQKSRSRQLIAAAHIVTMAWCLSFFWHYHFAKWNITWGYAVIDAAIAAVFWRQAQRAIVALPLLYVHVACIGLYFATTILQVSHWWMMAIANRLFEFEILYVIGCSLFRIRKLQEIKKGRADGAPEFLG